MSKLFEYLDKTRSVPVPDPDEVVVDEAHGEEFQDPIRDEGMEAALKDATVLYRKDICPNGTRTDRLIVTARTLCEWPCAVVELPAEHKVMPEKDGVPGYVHMSRHGVDIHLRDGLQHRRYVTCRVQVIVKRVEPVNRPLGASQAHANYQFILDLFPAEPGVAATGSIVIERNRYEHPFDQNSGEVCYRWITIRHYPIE